MPHPSRLVIALCGLGASAVLATAAARAPTRRESGNRSVLVAQGKEIFRFDTFGDESKWTDTLRLHEVIPRGGGSRDRALGRLEGRCRSPARDRRAGNPGRKQQPDEPATTVALLKLNAVVGVKGTVETINGTDTLTRVGITCALCHSTVDDSFAPGIGKRLDGWPTGT